MKERNSKELPSFWYIHEQTNPLRIARKVRDRISPEMEYIFGAVATYTYLATLTDPSLLPLVLEEISDILQKMPLYKLNMATSSIVSGTMVVDGARRIATERLPLLKMSSAMMLDNLKKKVGK